MDGHSNPDDLAELTAEVRRLREAITAAGGNGTPALSVADTDTGGFPVLRPARMPRRAVRDVLDGS